MKHIKQQLLSLLFLAASLTTFAQVGVGTTTPEGALDVKSTTTGLVVPRVANTAAVVNPQGGAIPNGTLVYDLSSNCAKSYENGAWSDCLSGLDNLGNHTATQNLDLATSKLVGNGGTEGIFITSNGNVGIGTTSTGSKLDVRDNTAGVFAAKVMQLNTSASGLSISASPSAGYAALNINGAGATTGVLIIASTPSSGTASLTTAGVWTNASDRRIKNKIRASKYGLKDVMKLRPVDYRMKKTHQKQVGFIAQEVREIIPEVVSGTEGDLSKGETLGISYGNLVAVLTKAIQEQQAMIDKLKSENTALKAETAKISELTAEINAIKVALRKDTFVVSK